MDTYDWIAFTSPTGVKVFFQEMKKARMDIRALSRVKIAAIGTGTKRELEERGLFVDLMPEVYDGAFIWGCPGRGLPGRGAYPDSQG